ncbi:L,D-transpeptidase family protein [Roseisolibacter agri]|uniref:Murein L,D-transpeptidase n=1 Tax=Roseisolibacter agri TaxID=2014610 RepID=A0AA37QK58_9BACT|nr:L,D-transpeptidase family protein [Roseisolibacter agri]GLC28398.1 murein L,D-transpeptidase [Roseisolibacter agri]
MSHRRPAPRFLLPLVLAAAAAGCDVKASAEDGGKGAAASSGEVDRSWTAPTVAAVAGVPSSEVKSAIEQRLGGARPDGLADDQWRHVKTLYGRFGRTPLWMDEDGPDKARATALLRALVDADQDALRLDAYPLPALANALNALRSGKPTAAQLAETDVLMSAAFTALGEDLITGQLNPRTVTEDWHIDPKEEEVDTALVRAMQEPATDQALDRLRPQDPDYAALRKALVQYRDLSAKGSWAAVPAGRALKPGEPDAATRLQALRARLSAEGLTSDSAAAAPTSEGVSPANAAGAGDSAQRKRAARVRPPRAGEAVYDAALAGAVAEYQARHGIVVDSILGEQTVKSMNLSPSYRLGQIAANLERHRWMPRALGAKHIAVNVPAFRLEAWDQGKKALDMKVIVGAEYEDRRTAVFSDTMTTVVFRPYWFVTDDIATKELWPKQQADPGYFAANNYETFQEGGQTRIRQTPGEENSLGLVKFLFPNAYNIYLHDTPNRELFGKDVRAFSHGCIRVEKPAELAQWVLGWDAARVQEAMNSGKDNVETKVPQRVPVYITYFTVYTQDGQLRFGNDLYDRDAKMIQALTAEAGQKPETVAAVKAIRTLVAER